MKVKNKYSGRTLTLKDEEWELIKEVPKAVQELSDKITDEVMECVKEYLPKKIPKGGAVKFYEMTPQEVKKTLDWLNGKWVDRYVEVPAVNALLRILGYVDLFVCDYDADKQEVYHFNMIEERAKYESDKQMASR